MTLDIRPAVPGDLPALIALDSVTASEPTRGNEIAEWIADGSCFVAIRNGQPVGYGVLHHHFFHRGMLDLVTVDPQHRQTGVGQALVRHAMTMCQTPQLWTSTNQSNTIMQALLVRMGFVPSGMVEGLDIGDPELFFRIDTSAR